MIIARYNNLRAESKAWFQVSRFFKWSELNFDRYVYKIDGVQYNNRTDAARDAFDKVRMWEKLND